MRTQGPGGVPPLHFVASLCVLALSPLALGRDTPDGAEPGGAPAAPTATARLLRAGPVLGYDGHQAIRIWAAPAKPDAKLEVAIAEEAAAEGETAVSRLIPMPAVAAGAEETTLRIDGLKPRTRYRYKVRVDGVASESTSGAFTSGPLPGKPVKGRLGVVSCMHAQRHPRQAAFAALFAEGPDLLLHLGDNIYANSTDPGTVRAWFTEQRNVPEYAPGVRTTPSLAIWDDHDYGANDSDGTLPGKERSLETFRALWPNPHPGGLPGTPGVFFEAHWGDVDIFLLDTRYHRSPNDAKDDVAKTMLGAAQMQWLEERVAASKARFKLIGSGSTIYAGLKDTWKGYTRERKRLVALTQRHAGIVFLTGDIHTSLVARLERTDGSGYPVYEIVSSGVAVNTSSFFYTTIDVDTLAEEPALTVRIHRLDKNGKEAKVDETVIRAKELVPAM